MEKFKVSFEANNQQLKSIGTKHASDTYADIEAEFVLGNRWTDMDSVSAVWWNDFTRVATVLDSQGKCVVPHEVLARKGCVRVNLVGSIVEGDELITRLTSYSAEAVQVNEKIKLTGSETSEVTPSQYEQFVANVKADADRAEAGATASAQSAQNASESATASANSASDSAQSAIASAQSAQNASESAITAENAKNDAEDARDKILGMRATAETLEAGSDATASYSDGLLTLGIPRGDKGEQGIQGETGITPNFSIGEVDTLEPNESATATITGTAENPVLNLGIPKGEQGDVNLSQLEALLPTETASGEIVTITDGQSVVPAKSLKVTLEPIQEGSGTPSPDNIRPISGHTEVVTHRTGVNLWNPNGEFALMDCYLDGGTPQQRVGQEVHLPAGTYTVKLTLVGQGGFIYLNKVSKSGTYLSFAFLSTGGAGNTRAVTLSDGDYLLIFDQQAAAEGASTKFGGYNIQLELGSTATDYEPYQGTTYTTSLGQTVYGGTLDVVSGELTVDRAMVTLDGSSDEAFGVTPLSGFTQVGWNNYISIGKAFADFVSDKFAFGRSGGVYETGLGKIWGGSVPRCFMGLPPEVTDTATARQWFSENPTTIVYELATPQTIQLTPQEVQLLLGTNNVWSDGEVTLVYNADIQKWVEKKLQS